MLFAREPTQMIFCIEAGAHCVPKPTGIESFQRVRIADAALRRPSAVFRRETLSATTTLFGGRYLVRAEAAHLHLGERNCRFRKALSEKRPSCSATEFQEASANEVSRLLADK